MDRVPVSVVIIARNEEENIIDCINSVKGWADEVLVVDDESTDKTRKLAENLGARVLVRKMDIEGRHRNWAYQQAKNDWVLSLDADERVTDELREEIDNTLSETEHTHFTIPLRTYIGNYWIKGGGWYPGPKVRLFQKDKFRYEEVEVHPMIEAEGNCGHLRCDIAHYNFKDWEDFLKKTNKQTTLEARKWYKLSLENPKKVRYKMNFPHVLWRMFDRFFRTFIQKRGYKDGFVGFMIAYMSALYQIVSYAKFREMKRNLHRLK